MAKLLLAACFLATALLVHATVPIRQISGQVNRQFGSPSCSNICFTLSGSERRAELSCRDRPNCGVRPCERNGRSGFSCATVSPSPAPIPISEGPIEVPTILRFPPDIEIGGKIEVVVNVTVDDVSSTTREDFYLLSDATGSMTAQIASVQDRFGMLVNARREASGDVAFGVGYYRDEEDSPPFENLQSITKDLGAVDNAINRLEAKDGGDTPEANLFAINQVATESSIGWREGSRKILVYFGDAPGHEPTCPAGSGPLTRDAVVNQLNDKGIAVVSTNFATAANQGLDAATFSARGPTFGCPAQETTPVGQATRITSGTLGALRLSNDPRALIDVILESIESLPQELSVSTTDCDGKVAITFAPDLPIKIAAGETKTIIERAMILPGACEFPDGFTCEINLDLSGVGVKQTIQTTTIAGCVPDDGGFP